MCRAALIQRHAPREWSQTMPAVGFTLMTAPMTRREAHPRLHGEQVVCPLH